MSFSNLFKGGYWFSQPIPAENASYQVMVGVLLVLIAIGFVSLFVRYYRKPQKAYSILLQKTGNMNLTMGIIGFALLFMRQQSVPLFGWRIWFLFWGIIFVIWDYKIAQFYFKRIPEIKRFEEEKARKEKYLP